MNSSMKPGSETVPLDQQWYSLIDQAEFPAEGKFTAKINSWHILVVKTETGLYAVNDCCTHQASPLSTGRIRQNQVMCPLHGARFDLETGKSIGGAYKPLRTFPLRIHGGMIEVSLPEQSPTSHELPTVF